MSDILRAEIRLLNDGIKFSSTSENYPEIVSDYDPPLGRHEGYRPLELFLISFGTCVGGTVLPILRRMQKDITSFAMTVEGNRKSEHPTGFNKIILNFAVKSHNLNEQDMQKAITLSEEKFCPVWSMIGRNVTVETIFHIDR